MELQRGIAAASKIRLIMNVNELLCRIEIELWLHWEMCWKSAFYKLPILSSLLCSCNRFFFIYIYIYIYHHHHLHVMPLAQISLTLSRHFSPSFIASGRSSGLHPVSSHSCCMYVCSCWSSCFCSAICGSP